MRNAASTDGTALANPVLARTGLATPVGGAAAADRSVVPGAASTEGSASLILTFDTLTPVPGPGAGPADTVRGIAGGSLPWLLGTGAGSLSCDGHLRVRIRGLVLAGHPPVPAALRGTNPFPAFRVTVSWLTTGTAEAAGTARTAAFASVSTGDFEASPAGDCDIDARVSIPQPCHAPVVLVTGPAGVGNWLAVTWR